MRSLLVLRPEPGAASTVARASALGLRAIAAPLFTVVPLAWEPPAAEVHDALMFTSANALRHAGTGLDRYQALPVYAVGRATAAAARAAGFATVHTGPSDAAALLAFMAAQGITRPLHLAGREHRAARHPGVAVTRRLVYAADPVVPLPPAARVALANGAVALLHSARAAAHFRTLVDPAGAAIAAISPAAAEAAGPGWHAIAIAATPDDPALLAAARALCETDG